MSENINLAGFGGRFRATESLWSIGSKICWANRISSVYLYRATNKGNRGSTPNFLVTGLKFDFGRLAKMTGIDAGVLKDGTGLCLSTDTTLLAELAFPHLRYCPQCMASGFHSILFQFPLFSCCPQHGDPLLEHCACGAAMNHKWPGGQRKAFVCEHCDRALWRPNQDRFTPDRADRLFVSLRGWSVGWIDRTLRFANSGAPLRRWVRSPDDARWQAVGLPEMAGVFSPRALRGRDADYWGARHVLPLDSFGTYAGVADTYLDVAYRFGERLGIPVTGCGDWLRRYRTKPSLHDKAFAVWRCFWEGVTEVDRLSADDELLGRAELIPGILNLYFRHMLVPGGYSKTVLEDLNVFVLRALLEASFVHALTIAQPGVRSGRVLLELPGTPLPVFLVKPTAQSIIVEWVHQRAIGKTAKRVLFDGVRKN